jgi:hypothetical protein
MRPHPVNRALAEAAKNASISTKLDFSAPNTPIIHLYLLALTPSGSCCVGQEYICSKDN